MELPVTSPGAPAPTAPAAPVATEAPTQVHDTPPGMVEEAPTQPGSDKFAQLAEKERMLYMERKKFNDERKQWEQQYSQWEAAKSDPMKALEAAGHSWDSVVDSLVKEEEHKDSQATPEEIEERVLKRLKEEQAKEEESKKTQEAENTVKTQIKEQIDSSGEFGAIQALGEYDLVYDVILKDFEHKVKTYGEEYAQANTMPVSQAAQKVEEQLVKEVEKVLQSEHIKNLALKLWGISGDQGVGPEVKPELFKQEPNQSRSLVSGQSKLPQTLTNDAFAPGGVPSEPKRRLSTEESLEHASKLIRWT